MTANEMEALFRLKFDGLYEFIAPDISQEMVSTLLTEAQGKVVLRKYRPGEGTGFEASEEIRRDLEQLLRHVKIFPTGDPTNPAVSIYGGIALNSNKITFDNIEEYTASLVVGDYIYHSTYPGGKAVILDIGEDKVVTVDRVSTGVHAATALHPHVRELFNYPTAHPNSKVFRLPSNMMFAIEEAILLQKFGISHVRETVVKPVTHDEYVINKNNPYKLPYEDLAWRLDSGGNSMITNNKQTEIVYDTNYDIYYYRLVFVAQPPAIVCGDNPVNCILNENIQGDIVDEAVLMASAAVKQENYQINMNEVNRS